MARIEPSTSPRRDGAAGIRVNAVAPGSIRTERYDAYLAEQSPQGAVRIGERMAQVHPLGRVGRVEEVTDTVGYLLSDAASFITGAVLPSTVASSGPAAGPGTLSRNARAPWTTIMMTYVWRAPELR